MSSKPHRSARPRLERLEVRLAMSLAPGADTFGLTPPANAIDVSLGDATRPGSPAATTAAISPQNITQGKATTEFGVFVRPYGSSGIVPRIVAVEQDGKTLPLQLARSYSPRQAGSATNQSVAFFETGQPGTVTILVSGRGLSSGPYTVETTLVGDVNGDGTVNIADVQPFAKTYVESLGDKDYNPAADYNQNGIVNLYDALAMERNMTPLTRPGGGWAAVNLTPNDAANFPGSKTSGGRTFNETVTIDGYTTPGSVVLVDSSGGLYTFGSQALAPDSNGFFSVKAKNTQGINNFQFKILDPFGHQYIRDYPVFWIPYAIPNSKFHYKPGKKSSAAGGKIS